MLDYLVTSRARRELLRLVWGDGEGGSVSSLARRVGLAFSTVHRELQAMKEAGLVVAERRGNQLLFERNDSAPYAALLEALLRPRQPEPDVQDDRVRGWLHGLGAPLPTTTDAPMPCVADVVAKALVLAHRDATTARVLPFVLWKQWRPEDALTFEVAAAACNELAALGLFLELAGAVGGRPELGVAARRLKDRRRTTVRPFFVRSHGRYAEAAARRNTPPVARRWGFLMNMGLDSFASVFEKQGAA